MSKGKGALHARVTGGHASGATTGLVGPNHGRPPRPGEREPAVGVDPSTVVADRPAQKGPVVPEADVDGAGPRAPERAPARATESGAASVFRPSKP